MHGLGDAVESTEDAGPAGTVGELLASLQLVIHLAEHGIAQFGPQAEDDELGRAERFPQAYRVGETGRSIVIRTDARAGPAIFLNIGEQVDLVLAQRHTAPPTRKLFASRSLRATASSQASGTAPCWQCPMRW